MTTATPDIICASEMLDRFQAARPPHRRDEVEKFMAGI
jgi:hypothetical protein